MPTITKPKGFTGSENTASHKLSLLTAKQLAIKILLWIPAAVTVTSPPHLPLQLSSLSLPFPFPALFCLLVHMKNCYLGQSCQGGKRGSASNLISMQSLRDHEHISEAIFHLPSHWTRRSSSSATKRKTVLSFSPFMFPCDNNEKLPCTFSMYTQKETNPWFCFIVTSYGKTLPPVIRGTSLSWFVPNVI